MFRNWIKRQKDFYYGNTDDGSQKLFISLGPLEIILIVVAVILIFGVGKIGNLGGALGKSIREFKREKDRVDDDPKSTTSVSKEENSSKAEVESKVESKK